MTTLAPLPEVTAAEIAAARLRRMAKDLILEAEYLEASIPKKPRKQTTMTAMEMLFGPKKTTKRRRA